MSQRKEFCVVENRRRNSGTAQDAKSNDVTFESDRRLWARGRPTAAAWTAALHGRGTEPGFQLLERFYAGEFAVAVGAGHIEQNRLHARIAGSYIVDGIHVPHIEAFFGARLHGLDCCFKDLATGFSTPTIPESVMLSKQSAMPQRASTRSIPPSAFEITAMRKFWASRVRASRVPGRIWSQFAEFWVFSTRASRTLAFSPRSCSR